MGKSVFEFGDIFCYYFLEYITSPFGFQLRSFFNVHDPRVWFLMESPSSCIFFSQLLSSFSKSSYFFLFIDILSLISEILSSTCSSLLE
jgi:hypothetical protein